MHVNGNLARIPDENELNNQESWITPSSQMTVPQKGVTNMRD